jgi:hypothetical protein
MTKIDAGTSRLYASGPQENASKAMSSLAVKPSRVDSIDLPYQNDDGLDLTLYSERLASSASRRRSQSSSNNWR